MITGPFVTSGIEEASFQEKTRQWSVDQNLDLNVDGKATRMRLGQQDLRCSLTVLRMLQKTNSGKDPVKVDHVNKTRIPSGLS